MHGQPNIKNQNTCQESQSSAEDLNWEHPTCKVTTSTDKTCWINLLLP